MRNMGGAVVLLFNEPKTFRRRVPYLDFLQNPDFLPDPRTKPILSKIFPTAARELADQGYSVSRQTSRG